MISPQDLKRRNFSKTLKGYNPVEVDEFVSYLISKYSEAYAEYAELERKYNYALERLEEAKSEQNTISATIVNAQKMADAIVSDAKEKANSVRNAVSETCDKILDTYVAKVALERDKLDKTEKAVAEFKQSLYNAYKVHISYIDSIMPDEQTPYLSDEELAQKAVDIAKQKIDGDTGVEDVPADTQPEQQETQENN